MIEAGGCAMAGEVPIVGFFDLFNLCRDFFLVFFLSALFLNVFY
jgi:hypothetical protein